MYIKKSAFTYPRQNTALHASVKMLWNISGIIYSRESFPAQCPVRSCKSRKNEVWLYILKLSCEHNFTSYMKALSSYTLVLLLPQIFSFPSYSSPFRGDSSNLICCGQVWFAIMFENRYTPQVWHGSICLPQGIACILKTWGLLPSLVTSENRTGQGVRWSSNESNFWVGDSFGSMWHLTRRVPNCCVKPLLCGQQRQLTCYHSGIDSRRSCKWKQAHRDATH